MLDRPSSESLITEYRQMPMLVEALCKGVDRKEFVA